MSDFLKAYRFEMYPNQLQKEYLASCFGCYRLVYNKILGDILSQYTEYEKARKEFYSHPRNQEKDENGKFIHKFTPEEQTEFFYSFPENKGKTFTPVVKPPVTRDSMGRKDSGIVKVSDLRDSITDDNGVNFLKDIDSIALNGATTAIEKAFKVYESRKSAGLPKFKTRNSQQSFTTRRSVSASEDATDLMCGNLKLDVENGKILLPKFGRVWKQKGEIPGWIKVVLHRDIRLENNPCTISSATISLTPAGKYYVSLLVRYEKNPFEVLDDNKNEAGVSYSFTNNAYIVASDDSIKYKYNADFEKLRRIDKHIEDLQEKRSRMQGPSRDKDGNFVSPSNNYKKMTLKINKLFAHRSAMVDYMQHCISKELIEKYGTIYARDLEAKDFIESKKADNPDMTNDDIAYLNKQVSSLAVGGFLSKLEYKAEAYNRVVYKIDKFYPCSKTCSSCGEVVEERAIVDGKWECPHCHTKHVVCENSAKNILSEGRTIGVSTDDYKDEIKQRKKAYDGVVEAIRSHIYDVINKYNKNNETPIRMSKGKILSLAKVAAKAPDKMSDEDIISTMKDMTSNKKRSKIKQ